VDEFEAVIRESRAAWMRAESERLATEAAELRSTAVAVQIEARALVDEFRGLHFVSCMRRRTRISPAASRHE